MTKKTIILSLLLLFGIGLVKAQNKAYTYVQQGGKYEATKGTKYVAVNGTAAFDLSETPTVEFDENGRAVMTLGDKVVALLPMRDAAELVVDFKKSSPVEEDMLNKVNKTVTFDFATIYSPFQLVAPSEDVVEVYAPTYNSETSKLELLEKNKIAAGEIIPAGTGLILKQVSSESFTFKISDDVATATQKSALDGSAILIDVPEVSGKTIFTLGHAIEDYSKFAFLRYTGTVLNPGVSYLVAPSLSVQSIHFAFEDDEDLTGIISSNKDAASSKFTKYLKNGRIVISNGKQKFNTFGHDIK